MSVESIPAVEYDESKLEEAYGDFADVGEQDTLTEQVEQVERGRFMAAAGRVAGRLALVGGLAAGLLAGQGQEPAEAAAPPCFEGVEKGVQIGQLCITKQEVRASGTCSTADKIIGITAMAIVLRYIPVGGNIKDITSYGFDLTEAIRGGFCD